MKVLLTQPFWTEWADHVIEGLNRSSNRIVSSITRARVLVAPLYNLT